MQVFELKGELRTDLGKKATKVLREEKKVPCVLYGGKENIHFSVVEKDLSKLVYTPFVYIVKIMIDGNAYEAVMREIQFHPVTDRILHIDFYHIFAEKPVIIEVPVKLKGFAEGVQAWLHSPMYHNICPFYIEAAGHSAVSIQLRTLWSYSSPPVSTLH